MTVTGQSRVPFQQYIQSFTFTLFYNHAEWQEQLTHNSDIMYAQLHGKQQWYCSCHATQGAV